MPFLRPPQEVFTVFRANLVSLFEHKTCTSTHQTHVSEWNAENESISKLGSMNPCPLGASFGLRQRRSGSGLNVLLLDEVAADAAVATVTCRAGDGRLQPGASPIEYTQRPYRLLWDIRCSESTK